MNSTIIKQMEQARKIIKVITGNNYRVQKLEKDTRKVVRSINPEIEEKFDKLNVLPYGYTLTFPFLNIFVITNNEEEYQMDMSDAENGIVFILCVQPFQSWVIRVWKCSGRQKI